MASFTTRVELHSGTYSDYETLHAAMERRGFSRLITSDGGKTYKLPLAEYDRTANLTREQILDSAREAAAETGKRNAVLVTESVGRMWVGLEEVSVGLRIGR